MFKVSKYSRYHIQHHKQKSVFTLDMLKVLYTSQIFILLTCKPVFSIRVENSVEPYKMASSETRLSGSTVFSKKDESGFRRT